MRTTLTLDEDVAHLLKLEMKRSGASLKETVNKGLRIGLTAPAKTARKPFVVTPLELNLPPDWTSVSELLEELEGPLHR